MGNIGRLLYVGGIALGIFFATLSFISAGFLLFFDTTGALSDIRTTAAFIGIPLGLALASFWMLHIGQNMQKGRSGRIGGFFILLIGVGCIIVSTSYAWMPPVLYPQPGYVSYANGILAITALLSFGVSCVAWGLRLIQGKALTGVPYVFQAPEASVYQKRKRDLAHFLLVLAVSVPFIGLIFYFFVK